MSLETRQPTGAYLRTDRNALFVELTRRVREAGLFEKKLSPYLTTFSSAVVVHVGLLLLVSQSPSAAISALLLTLDAIAVLRIGFVAHDLTHGAVRSEPRIRAQLAELVWSFFLGVSRDYWHAKHTLHHRFPNVVSDRDGDPDIVAPPMVLGPHQAGQTRAPVGRWVVRHQHLLYWPVLSVVVFVLMGESLVYLVTSRFRGRLVRPTSPRALVGVVILLGLVASNLPLFVAHSPAVAVGLVVYRYLAAGFVIGFTFALNHVGLPTLGPDDAVDPLTSQTLTTRNITGPFGRWFWGVLAFQIEHHLWPSLPWHAMPRAAELTRAFCEEHGIVYQEQTPGRAVLDACRALRALGQVHGVAPRIAEEGP